MIILGQKVRDVVTGFEGIADCRMEWLNGCVRVGVQPVARKDKEDGHQYVPDSKSFDEMQLEILDEKPIALPRHKTPRQEQMHPQARRTGGGRPDPPARRDPAR